MENKDILDNEEYGDVINIILYNILKKNFEKYAYKKYNTLLLDNNKINKYIDKLNNEKFISKIKCKTLKIIDNNYFYDKDYFLKIWDEYLLDKDKCKNQLRLELYKYRNELKEKIE